MRMALLVVALALLTLGLTAGAIATVDSTGESTASSVLMPPADEEPIEHAYGSDGDLGLRVSATDTTLRVAVDHHVVAADLAAVPPAERTDIAQAYLDDLEGELDGLAAAEQEAIASLNDTPQTAEETVRTLARVAAVANARQATLDDLATFDGTVPSIDLGQMIASLDARYAMHTSPVRERILAGASDPAEPVGVVLLGSAQRLSLATTTELLYHRESVRYDRQTSPTTGSLDNISQAESIVAEAYPNSRETIAARQITPDVYLIQRSLPTGTLTAYVDAGSEAVFMERQQRWVDAESIAGAHTATERGMEIQIDWTFRGGPMEISLQDADDGTPVDGTVYLRVGGIWTKLGPTVDGSLWSVEPTSAYDVRIVTADGPVTISVEE